MNARGSRNALKVCAKIVCVIVCMRVCERVTKTERDRGGRKKCVCVHTCVPEERSCGFLQILKNSLILKILLPLLN